MKRLTNLILLNLFITEPFQSMIKLTTCSSITITMLLGKRPNLLLMVFISCLDTKDPTQLIKNLKWLTICTLWEGITLQLDSWHLICSLMRQLLNIRMLLSQLPLRHREGYRKWYQKLKNCKINFNNF